MSLPRIVFSLATVALLCIGTAVAENPPQPTFEGEYVAIDNATVRPLRVTTQNIWSEGGIKCSSSVAIRFNINQRARVWVAVYRGATP